MCSISLLILSIWWDIIFMFPFNYLDIISLSPQNIF
jgi:hypothetical protein